MLRLIFLPAMLLLLPLSPPAFAAGSAPDGYFTLQLENDKFVGTDRHYTHGTRLSWVWEDESKVPGWVSGLLDRAYIFSTPRKKQMGIVLGQNIFTPENTLTQTLSAGDRPYAGWSYVGLSLHAEVDGTFLNRYFEALDTFEVDFGVVGPQSYAKEAQNGIHRLIGTDEAHGWSHQLKNEPTANLMLERVWRSPTPHHAGMFEWDVLPALGFSLGNVHSHVGGGAVIRFGHALDVDYGPPKIQPSLPGRAAFTTLGNREWGWYLYAGAEGRYVAHNLFLDGNTFTDSHSVERNPWVADFRIGAVLTHGRVRIALTQVHRTREFKGQRQGDDFGALTATIRF